MVQQQGEGRQNRVDLELAGKAVPSLRSGIFAVWHRYLNALPNFPDVELSDSRRRER